MNMNAVNVAGPKKSYKSFRTNPLPVVTTAPAEFDKLVSHTSFHLKGTGWYATDYAAKSRTSSSNEPTKNKAETTAETGATGTGAQPKSSDK